MDSFHRTLNNKVLHNNHLHCLLHHLPRHHLRAWPNDERFVCFCLQFEYLRHLRIRFQLISVSPSRDPILSVYWIFGHLKKWEVDREQDRLIFDRGCYKHHFCSNNRWHRWPLGNHLQQFWSIGVWLNFLKYEEENWMLLKYRK